MIAALALWAVVAAVLGALALGLGLLLERAAGRRLPSALLAPLGLAALLVIGDMASVLGLQRAVPVVFVAVAAVAGLTTRRGSARHPLAGVAWQGVVAVIAVAAFYLLAIAATGQATFGGYGLLADTAIHLVGADALPGSLGSIGPDDGAYGAMVHQYYEVNGYPRGGAAVLGMLSAAVGVDPVAALQSLLAIAMAALASAVWVLLTPLVPGRGVRAAGSAAAALSALTAGFVLLGSLKEVLAVTMLAATAAAVPGWRGDQDPWRPREVIPVAMTAAGALASIGLAAGVYLLPLGVVVLTGWVRALGPRRALTLAGAAAGLAALLSVPSLLRLAQQADVASNVLTVQTELGNLSPGGLPRVSVLGIWLGPDVRLRDDHHGLTLALAGLVALAGVAGLLAAARDRALGLLGWAAGTALATAIIVRTGSPWADAKALVIASPVLLALAAAGFGAAVCGYRRVDADAPAAADATDSDHEAAASTASLRWPAPVRAVAGFAGLLVCAGIATSLALAAGAVVPAPQERFAELTEIDERFAGDGPLLTGEFEEFTRHLLRRTRGEFAADPFGVPADRHGAVMFARSADQDQLDTRLVQASRLLLVRTGPAASRPPSNFVRVRTGRWYEVWRRIADLPVPRVHLALGDAASGGQATPTCADLKSFAAQARLGEALVAASRPAGVVVPAASYTAPAGWKPDGVHPDIVRPTGAARLPAMLTGLPPSAEVDVWLEASVTRRVALIAGDDRGGIGPQELNPIGSATRALTTRTSPDGTLSVTVIRAGAGPVPDGGDRRDWLGALGATPKDALGAARVVRLAPSQAGELCGKPLDWLELAPRRGDGARPARP